jgi:Bacteriophage tail sheath protein
MPATLTYPGVYIEEIPSGVRTITGVATSITAFIGRALRGPVNDAVVINSYGDFERIFGGLWVESTLSYAVRDFYLNGGSQAIIVRLFHPFLADAAARAAALDAAQDVSNAAAGNGGDANAVAAAARTEANAAGNAAEPRKSAADSVAKAAEAEAAKGAPPATPQTVKDAAAEAVLGATMMKATLTVGALKLIAAYEGKWGANLRATIDQKVSPDVALRMGLANVADLFNLTVIDAGTGGVTEKFLNLSVKESARRIDKVLEAESKLVRWDGTLDPNNPPALPTAETVDEVTKAGQGLKTAEDALKAAKALNPPNAGAVTAAQTAVDTEKANLDTATMNLGGLDGGLLDVNDFTGPGQENAKQGLFALRKADLFNLLCIPPYLPNGNVDTALLADATAYCQKRRAMMIIDPPVTWTSKDAAKAGLPTDIGVTSNYAALYFPRLRQTNPLRDNQMESFVPCGAVAGVMARTDTARGVWKAPAGLEATLLAVPQLSVSLTDNENGELNPLGINCLRAMPAAGRVVWGARTLEGDDRLASEWKYVPVRRTALYIEESLYRGTQWVVFEPNDEPLWSQIRLNVGAFMHTLFRQGAFQGQTPKDAYFVKCDKETTTQTDINLGVVNIIVGFAPLKPAEFVVIKLQQMAGQIET